jgi:hypothetical protein
VPSSTSCPCEHPRLRSVVVSTSAYALMSASRLDIVLSQLLGRVLSSINHRYCGQSRTWACICLYALASSAFWLSCDPRSSSVLSLALIEEFPVPGSLVREPQPGGCLHSRLALCERLIRQRGRQKAYFSCWKLWSLCSQYCLSLADITIPPLMEATEGQVGGSYYSPRLGTRAFVFFINFLLTPQRRTDLSHHTRASARSFSDRLNRYPVVPRLMGVNLNLCHTSLDLRKVD